MLPTFGLLMSVPYSSVDQMLFVLADLLRNTSTSPQGPAGRGWEPAAHARASMVCPSARPFDRRAPLVASRASVVERSNSLSRDDARVGGLPYVSDACFPALSPAVTV